MDTDWFSFIENSSEKFAQLKVTSRNGSITFPEVHILR